MWRLTKASTPCFLTFVAHRSSSTRKLMEFVIDATGRSPTRECRLCRVPFVAGDDPIYPDNQDRGRPTGFEPATSWTTTRCSNHAELRPPWVPSQVSRTTAD